MLTDAADCSFESFSPNNGDYFNGDGIFKPLSIISIFLHWGT